MKRNQKELYDELALVFEAYDAQMLPLTLLEQETVDKGHGRLEKGYVL